MASSILAPSRCAVTAPKSRIDGPRTTSTGSRRGPLRGGNRQVHAGSKYKDIVQTLSEQLPDSKRIQTATGQLDSLPAFPLSWSHYVRLLTVQRDDSRHFYEHEAFRGGSSVRQLNRQVASQLYERSKAAQRSLVSRPKLGDDLTPDEQIRDPFVLEFLGLKDEYSENELEEALIRHLEHFLLQLGGDFTFVARQKRLRVVDQWYRVGLLLFHPRIRCLILIDLKLGQFSHADAGPMNLYLNFAREHWTYPDEIAPIGLILASDFAHRVDADIAA